MRKTQTVAEAILKIVSQLVHVNTIFFTKCQKSSRVQIAATIESSKIQAGGSGNLENGYKTFVM
jgi:hypothetical protein